MHIVNGEWTVLDGESKSVDNMGSEQDGFTAPWNKDNSTTVQVWAPPPSAILLGPLPAYAPPRVPLCLPAL